MITKTYKGLFKPRNPNKYVGDHTNIVYRSSWECRVMHWFDINESVISWASEELVIPYISPVDNKKHRYFPDFVAKMKLSNGSIKTYVIEVKPDKQTRRPTQTKRTKRFLEESVTYAINQEKWRAADIFCQQQGWEFRVVTEKDLGIK